MESFTLGKEMVEKELKSALLYEACTQEREQVERV